MNIQFFIRGKSRSIYYRCSNGVNLTKILPYKLNPLDTWNKSNQSTNNNFLINKELLSFKTYLLDEVNNISLFKKNIDKELIIQLHNQYFNTIENIKKYEPTLLQYVRVFEKNYKLSPSSLKKLGTLKTKLKAIPSIKLKECGLTWINNFTNKLLHEGYAESSINKHLQLIKQIVKYADMNDLEIKRNILLFKMLKTNTINHYLNTDELNDLFDFTPSTNSLNNVKKLFLIGCTTGLRISDLMKIKTFRINNNMMYLITTKTKQNIVVPIEPRVKEFIDEVYPISHPKFNLYLKDLFREMKMNEVVEGYIIGKRNRRVRGFYPKWKLITSHTMRRSFATNLYGKVPTVVIMAITGHTTEKSFLTYIKKPQRHFAEQLKSYYNSTYKTG